MPPHTCGSRRRRRPLGQLQLAIIVLRTRIYFLPARRRKKHRNAAVVVLGGTVTAQATPWHAWCHVVLCLIIVRLGQGAHTPAIKHFSCVLCGCGGTLSPCAGRHCCIPALAAQQSLSEPRRKSCGWGRSGPRARRNCRVAPYYLGRTPATRCSRDARWVALAV